MSGIAGKVVLMVDDSMTIRKSAGAFLKAAGCELMTSENGFDALGVIAERRPDIIFLDVMMPILNGYDTCALIKQNPALKDIPVVMLTSKDGLFDLAKGRLVGCDEYLIKPFSKDSLLQALAKYFP